MSFAIESANPVVKAIIEGTAPRPARLAAARGILPLPQADLLEVLVAFATSDDAELVGSRARDRSGHRMPTLLNRSVRSADIPVRVLTYFATVGELPQKVHEAIIYQREDTRHGDRQVCGQDDESGAARADLAQPAASDPDAGDHRRDHRKPEPHVRGRAACDGNKTRVL